MTQKTQNEYKRYKQPYHNALNFSFCLVDLKIINSIWTSKNWHSYIFEYKTVEANQRAFILTLVVLNIVSHADIYDTMTNIYNTTKKKFEALNRNVRSSGDDL